MKRSRLFLAAVLLLCVAAGSAWVGWTRLRLPAQPARPATDEELVELTNRGLGYMEQFDEGHGFENAVKVFEEIVDRWPHCLPGKFNLAIALLNNSPKPENLERASQLLAEILEAVPDDARAHYTLGFVLQYRGRFSEARVHLEKVCKELMPGDAYSWMRLGDCLEDEEQREASASGGGDGLTSTACYERALELDPYLASAYYKLNQAMRRAGQEDRAAELAAQFGLLKQTIHYDEYAHDYIWSGPLAEAIGLRRPPHRPTERPLPVYAIDAKAEFVLAPGTQWAEPAELDAAGPYGPLLFRIRARFGAAVAVFDCDGDGRLDLLILASVVRDGQLRDVLLRNEGAGRFVDVTEQAGLGGPRLSIGCAAGDFDGDGHADLYVTAAGGNVLFRNTGRGTFEDVTEQAGVAEPEMVSLTALFMDLDHDGDLDLLVANYGPLSDAEQMFREQPYDGGAANAFFANVGMSRLADAASRDLPPLEVGFERISEPSDAWDRPTRTVGFVAADLDDDRDLDLVEINDTSPCRLLVNKRLQQWAVVPLPTDIVPQAKYNGGLAGDFDNDDHTDLVIVRPDGPALFLRNAARSVDRLPTFQPFPSDLSRVKTAQLFDADMDGWPDLLCLGTSAAGPVLALNRPRGMITRPEWLAGLLPDLSDGAALCAAAFDGETWPALLVVQPARSPILLRTEGNGNHGLAMRLTGRREMVVDPNKKTMRSNSSGIGARGVVHAGRARITWQNASRSTGLCQSLVPLSIGLSDRERADAVRMRWPDGVEQAELDLAADELLLIEETQRRGSSCPVLFAWNGHRFEFVTDLLGGGGIGYLVRPGLYADPDPDEDVRISSEQLAPNAAGELVLKIAEPMDEMTYLDSATLEVIDHPAALAVYPDERFDPETPHPSGDRFVFRDRMFPRAACDESGRDVLEILREWDRSTVDGFRCSAAWIGYAEEHCVELDFGQVFAGLGDDERVALFLAGWVEYPYAQTNWAAATAGARLQPPILEWRNGEGEWEPLIQNMGYPAGLPRMMTVDLTGKLPRDIRARDAAVANDCRLRIRTNMEIYWDQIFAARLESDSILRKTRLEPVRAALGYRGYMQEYSPDGRLPLVFDYERVAPALLSRLPGARTSYGDVRELVSHTDQRFVLVNAGDEMTLTYDASGLPPLPAGWSRTFVLCASGYCKDTELFNPLGSSVDPMPGLGTATE